MLKAVFFNQAYPTGRFGHTSPLIRYAILAPNKYERLRL